MTKAPETILRKRSKLPLAKLLKWRFIYYEGLESKPNEKGASACLQEKKMAMP
jgi:hypothetical protein